MAKDKKSEKKAAASKVKADKKATTAKVPALTKDILKKAVSTFNYFPHSMVMMSFSKQSKSSAQPAKVETNGKKVR